MQSNPVSRIPVASSRATASKLPVRAATGGKPKVPAARKPNAKNKLDNDLDSALMQAQKLMANFMGQLV